jgi:DNA-binding GntR family transcriptional regulator
MLTVHIMSFREAAVATPVPSRRLVRQSLSEGVADELRRALIAGELADGEPIPEVHVAARLGVSRGPVREALIELERDGVVEFDGRGRSLVRQMTAEDFEEIYQIRLALEPLAARLAAQRLTTEDRAVFERLLKRLDRCRDWATFHVWDVEFHEAVILAAHQRRLHASWHTLKLQMARWLVKLQRDRSLATGHQLPDTIEPHRRLIGLLLEGKAKTAETEMRWHIGVWAEWLPAIKAQE